MFQAMWAVSRPSRLEGRGRKLASLLPARARAPDVRAGGGPAYRAAGVD